MSLVNNGPFKIAFGFGLGIMAANVFREVLPALQGVGRPLLKAAVKSGAILARNGQVKIAEFRETLADVRAEVELELNPVSPEIPVSEPFVSREEKHAEIM